MKPEKTQPHVSPSTRRSNRGFTLVEMLVVITIIAALAGVIFVATRSFKNKAHKTNAMSILRQVAAFNLAYATENNGDINTLRWETDPLEGKPNWVKNSYWGRLQPYIFPNASGTDSALQKSMKQGVDGLFSTNTAKSPIEMKGTALSGARIYRDKSGLAVPFAFNVNLAPWNKFAKTSRFSDPSQLMYFTYGSGMFNADDGKAYVPMALAGQTVTNNIYYFDDKKTIAAFLDGHIESIEAPIPDRKFE
jgi:prepilin-type N-terminal cleavage/methylation domain-containing protein